MKTIILVRTYYSLMVAMNLAMTDLNNDEVDLVLTDSMVGSFDVYQRLKQIKFFRNVYYIKTDDFLIKAKQSYFRRKFELLERYILFYLKPEKLLKDKYNIVDKYDKLFVFQVNIDIELCFYNYCFNRNSSLKLYIYEEAYLSYFADDGALKIYTADAIALIGHILHKKNMRNSIDTAYYFRPDFVQFKPYFKIQKMRSFTQNSDALVKSMNYIFNYNPELCDEKKYIYVEDSYHEQGIEIGDFDLVLKLKKYLGNELVVKLHPRTKYDRFTGEGIAVMYNNKIPLELYALNRKNNNIALISMYSSGIISSSLCNDCVKSFFIFPLSKQHNRTMEVRLEKIVPLFSDKCRIISDLYDIEV